MITVVSMSPCIDRRLEFDGFHLSETNRVKAMREEGAGKGVDVALAVRALGLPVCCIGLLAGAGEAVSSRLSRNGVPYEFLDAPGVVRTNYKLFDRENSMTTEANEPSPEAPEALLAEMADRAVTAAKDSEYLVLTGSLPVGCPPGWYADVLRRIHAEAPGCRCVLDADGERLALGIAARPWLIKPNRDELEQAAGKELSGLPSYVGAARALCKKGAEVVVVSLGGDGALIVSGTEAAFVQAIPVTVRTTTGAGDAMVAGLLWGFSSGEGPSGALRHGTAAAAARCAFGGDAYLEKAFALECLHKSVAKEL